MIDFSPEEQRALVVRIEETLGRSLLEFAARPELGELHYISVGSAFLTALASLSSNFLVAILAMDKDNEAVPVEKLKKAVMEGSERFKTAMMAFAMLRLGDESGMEDIRNFAESLKAVKH